MNAQHPVNGEESRFLVIPSYHPDSIEDFDWIYVACDLEFADTIPALRHLSTVMPRVFEAVRERQRLELGSFLDWLLRRAHAVLLQARESEKQGCEWVAEASACVEQFRNLSVTCRELVTSPSADPDLWKTVVHLESRLDSLREIFPKVEKRLSFYQQLIPDMRPHFDAWAAAYEQLPNWREEFDFAGLLRQDERGISFLLVAEEVDAWMESLGWPPDDDPEPSGPDEDNYERVWM